MTSANINMSFPIDSKSLGGSNKDNVENLTGGGRAMTYLVLVTTIQVLDNEDLNDEKNENTAEYNNKIQWDLDLHSLTYLNNRGQKLKQFINVLEILCSQKMESWWFIRI